MKFPTFSAPLPERFKNPLFWHNLELEQVDISDDGYMNEQRREWISIYNVVNKVSEQTLVRRTLPASAAFNLFLYGSFGKKFEGGTKEFARAKNSFSSKHNPLLPEDIRKVLWPGATEDDWYKLYSYEAWIWKEYCRHLLGIVFDRELNIAVQGQRKAWHSAFEDREELRPGKYTDLTRDTDKEFRTDEVIRKDARKQFLKGMTWFGEPGKKDNGDVRFKASSVVFKATREKRDEMYRNRNVEGFDPQPFKKMVDETGNVLTLAQRAMRNGFVYQHPLIVDRDDKVIFHRNSTEEPVMTGDAVSAHTTTKLWQMDANSTYGVSQTIELVAKLFKGDFVFGRRKESGNMSAGWGIRPEDVPENREIEPVATDGDAAYYAGESDEEPSEAVGAFDSTQEKYGEKRKERDPSQDEVERSTKKGRRGKGIGFADDQ